MALSYLRAQGFLMPVSFYLPLPGPFAYTPPRRPGWRTVRGIELLLLPLWWVVVGAVAGALWLGYGVYLLARWSWCYTLERKKTRAL
jgi:hypothetical protein